MARFTTTKAHEVQTNVKRRPSTHYSALSVRPGSSDHDIRAKYLELAVQFHPDKRPADLEYFKTITAAYSVLKDADRRRAYDMALKLFGNQCEGCKGTGTQRFSVGFSKVRESDCQFCEGTGQNES